MDDKLALSQEAHALLVNPAFKRAFDGARARIIQIWENELDPQRRDSAWHMLKALDQVKAALTQDASLSLQEEVKAKALQPR
jgi:hypothetical protein